MTAKITRAFERTYRDNGQTVSGVEWIDTRGRHGQTVDMQHCSCCGKRKRSAHMESLFARARREGVSIEIQAW